MTSIALGVFIVFILYVMFWSIRNDRAKSIAEQTGFLRMRDSSGAGRKSTGASGHRPQAEGSAPSRRSAPPPYR